MRKRFFISYLILAVITAGPAAAKKADEAIRNAPANDLQLAEVTKQPSEFTGGKVRWGGSILTVEQQDDTVRLEILQRPLNKKGKPNGKHSSDGRFVAYIPASEFNTKQNSPGRFITVAGTLSGQETLQISPQLALTLPVVGINTLHTWRSSNTNIGFRHGNRYGYGHRSYRGRFFYGHSRYRGRGFYGGFRRSYCRY